MSSPKNALTLNFPKRMIKLNVPSSNKLSTYERIKMQK